MKGGGSKGAIGTSSGLGIVGIGSTTQEVTSFDSAEYNLQKKTKGSVAVVSRHIFKGGAQSHLNKEQTRNNKNNLKVLNLSRSGDHSSG
eukprot:CAMPEP_0170487550 /NCGR_PEP_ID=MMETSP0208-20121228/6340_1 /TAXON_ID=197538 /ORGANISM="Strombidium inclinatum, Strain S3" /LENGTH=88 /DNA_ID=CAMNT_0010761871 /DNA_START=1540 /DNA_END=1806 /DNA_ORIENTATION=+